MINNAIMQTMAAPTKRSTTLTKSHEQLQAASTEFANSLVAYTALAEWTTSAPPENDLSWSMSLKRTDYTFEVDAYVSYDASDVSTFPEVYSIMFAVAGRACTLYNLFFYINPDERVHGRTATITLGINMESYIIISDNRVTGSRVGGILSAMHVVLALHTANCGRTAEDLRLRLCAAFTYSVSTWDVPAMPDMAKLFARAPAPVHVPTIPGVVTFAGGNVVVADVTTIPAVQLVSQWVGCDINVVKEIVVAAGILSDPIAARASIRILVSQPASVNTIIGRRDVCIEWDDDILHVFVRGSSLTQLASRCHTLYEKLRGFLTAERNGVDQEYGIFEDAFYGVTTMDEHLEEMRAGRRRHVAGHTIARILRQRVLARVWRPEGRLTAALMAKTPM